MNLSVLLLLCLSGCILAAPVPRRSVCSVCDCLDGGLLIRCARRQMTAPPPLLHQDAWLAGITRIIDLDYNFISSIEPAYWNQFPQLERVWLASTTHSCVATLLPPGVELQSGAVCPIASEQVECIVSFFISQTNIVLQNVSFHLCNPLFVKLIKSIISFPGFPQKSAAFSKHSHRRINGIFLVEYTKHPSFPATRLHTL